MLIGQTYAEVTIKVPVGGGFTFQCQVRAMTSKEFKLESSPPLMLACSEMSKEEQIPFTLSGFNTLTTALPADYVVKGGLITTPWGLP